MKQAPLRSLHATSSLSQVKLKLYARLTSDQLMQSLSPGQPGALKTRPTEQLLMDITESRFCDSEGLTSISYRENK